MSKNRLFVKNEYFKKSSQGGLHNHNVREKFTDCENVIEESERKNQDIYFPNISKNISDFSEMLEAQYKIQEDKKYFQSENTKKKANTLMTQIMVLPQEVIVEHLRNGDRDKIINSIDTYLEKLEMKYGLKCSSYHFHLDEGHFDKSDNKIILNTHIHFEFLNFDFEKGKTVMRTLKKSDFSHMQDLAANSFQKNDIEILRGVKSINSKNKNLSNEEFVSKKIIDLNSDLEFILNDFGIDQIENITIKQIEEHKIIFKDNKLLKRYFDYLFRIKEKQLKGLDYSKNLQRLETTVLKLSKEEEQLKAQVTFENENLSNIKKFKEWSSNPDEFMYTSDHEKSIERFEKVQEINVSFRKEVFEKTEYIETLEKLVEDNLEKFKIKSSENLEIQRIELSRQFQDNAIKALSSAKKIEESNKSIEKKYNKDNQDLQILLQQKIGLISNYEVFASKIDPKYKIAFEEVKKEYLDKFKTTIEPDLRERNEKINRGGDIVKDLLEISDFSDKLY